MDYGQTQIDLEEVSVTISCSPTPFPEQLEETELELDAIEVEMGEINQDMAANELSLKIESLVVDCKENRKLKGGHDDSDSEGCIFSNLFANEEEEFDTPKEPLDDVTALMADLELGSSDFENDTLEACLAQFCREELLSGENQFSCSNCARKTISSTRLNVSSAQSLSCCEDEDSEGSSSEGEKEKIVPVLRDAKCRYSLNTLPPILVIHLKRFTQDNRGFLQKDRRHIAYPVELDLGKFGTSGTCAENKYRLFGVVDHSGSLHRGHYIAYVRKRDTTIDQELQNSSIPMSAHIRILGQRNSERSNEFEKWYCCNDERVSEVPVKKVLNADAYLLFYERISPYS